MSQKDIDAIDIPVLKDTEMSNYVGASLDTKISRLSLLQREKERLECLLKDSKRQTPRKKPKTSK